MKRVRAYAVGVVALLGAQAGAQVFTHDTGTVGAPGTDVFLLPDEQDLFRTDCAGDNTLVFDGLLSLGLMPNDNIDALDDGQKFAEGDAQFTGTYDFSVLPGSLGQPGTDIDFLSPENGADLYQITVPGHALDKFDMDLGLAANTTDSVDGFTFESGGPIAPGTRIYFSLAPGSPTLIASGWSAADVLTVVVGLPITLDRAITATSLGLRAADNLDALILSDSTDDDGDGSIDGASDTMFAFFSVDAASLGLPGTDVASEVAGNGAQGDVFTSGGALGNQLLYDGRDHILLDAGDEMDALDAIFYGGGDIPPPPIKPLVNIYPGVRLPSGGFWINICDMTLPNVINLSIKIKLCDPMHNSVTITYTNKIVGFGGGNGFLKALIMMAQLNAATFNKPGVGPTPIFGGIQVRPPVGQPGNIVAQVCANVSQALIDCGYDLDGLCISMSNWTASIIPVPLREQPEPWKRRYMVTVPQAPEDNGLFRLTTGAPDPVFPQVVVYQTPFSAGESPSAILGRILDQILGDGGIATLIGTVLTIEELAVEPPPDSSNAFGPYIFEGGALDNSLGVTIEGFGAKPVPPTHPLGDDCWHTPENPGSTVRFGAGNDIPIPPGFFGPGSDPFFGEVPLAGVPVGPGNTDTKIGRLDDLILPGPFPACDQVEIEIRELHLQSTQPIVVTYNGGQNPEQWLVGMGLSEDNPPQLGVLTTCKDNPFGGGFDAVVPVQPVFAFTRVGDKQPSPPLPVNGQVVIFGGWDEQGLPTGVSTGPNWYGQPSQLQFLRDGAGGPAMQLQIVPATAQGGCNPADLAEPFGQLNFDDVIAFLVAFGAQAPEADLAPPFGQWNFDDVIAFLTAFGAGCP